MIITVKYYRGLPTLKEHIERACIAPKYHLLPSGILEVMDGGRCAIRVIRKEEAALHVQIETDAFGISQKYLDPFLFNLTALRDEEVQALTKLGHLPGEADMMLKLQS